MVSCLSMRALTSMITGAVIIAVLIIAGGCATDQAPTPPLTTNNPASGQARGLNHNPIIESIISEYHQIELGKVGGLRCIAHDEDGDTLTYTWSASRGIISGQGALVSYTAPHSYVDAEITVTVTDGRGGYNWGILTLPVVCCSYANKNSEWAS